MHSEKDCCGVSLINRIGNESTKDETSRKQPVWLRRQSEPLFLNLTFWNGQIGGDPTEFR
jgi:hypothetical protein